MEIVREFNKEVVISLMKDRGYGMVSENTGRKVNMTPVKCGQCKMEIDVKKIDVEVITLNFVKTVDIGVCIHAAVDMNSRTISLSMVELKFFATLNIGKFDFFHKDFEKYEKILYIYTDACLRVDDIFIRADHMVKVENKLPVTPPHPPAEEKVKKTKKDIPTRKREFWDQIVPIAKQKGLTKEFTMEFYNYWTEHGPNDRTFRKELQQKFDISRRLDTFVRNERKWSKDKTDKAAEKQDADLKTRKPNKKHEDLF